MHWSLIFYFFMLEHEPGIKVEVLDSFQSKSACENRITEIALKDKFLNENGQEYQLKLNKNGPKVIAFLRDQVGDEQGLVCVHSK